MKDEILDFIEDHKIVCIAAVVVVLLIVVALVVRSNNLKRKADEEAAQLALQQQQTALEEALGQDEVPSEEPKDSYQNQLGLDASKYHDERVPVNIDEPDPDPEPTYVQKDPRYQVGVDIFDHTEVPRRNMDGSSCKDYQSKVSLTDFGTFWGTSLTEADFKGHKRYFVGVKEQNYDPLNNLESSGWLISNLETLEPNDVIQFTNLHVIGSLSSVHVALLCSYDWYSAFGLKDTLIVFEDITNTLNASDFHDGDIFSATVFVHNIKIVDDVAGQRVIVCEYSNYDDYLSE